MSKYFKIKSNKSPLSYTVNEKIIFEIQARENGENINCECVSWEICGDDGKKASGIGSCQVDKPLILETSLSRSGFVHVVCMAVDKNKNKIIDFEVLDASAGADIHTLEYCDVVPDDFDEYWNDIKQCIADFQLEVLYKKQIFGKTPDDFLAFDIRIKTPFGRPASGFLTMPKAKGKYPLKIYFTAYGISGAMVRYCEDCIVGTLNAHGIENHLSVDELKKIYGDEFAQYGYSEEENASNMTTYWRNMMFRNLVAAKYLKSLSQWNGKDFSVYGRSQGAFQAITLAANDDDVKYLEVIVPWFCNLNAENSGFMQGHRPAFAQGLRYFDSVAQVRKVKCPIKIYAGLGDYVCPPATVMTLYNNISSEKNLIFMQCRTHDYAPRKEEESFVLKENV